MTTEATNLSHVVAKQREYLERAKARGDERAVQILEARLRYLEELQAEPKLT